MANSCEISEVISNDLQASRPTASQEELRVLYEEQQRRLACPDCGEEPFID